MSTSGCDLSSLLTGYVHDELSQTESRLVEAHVEGCPACAQQLAAEASVVDAMMGLAEQMLLEPEPVAVTAPPPTPSRHRWWAKMAWPSVFGAAALAFVMCDQAAMRAPADVVATPTAVATLATSRVDDTRPACEEPTWLGSESLAEGPVCDEPVTVALASFPPESSSEPWDDEWDDEPDVCLPSDGGDLACMPS